jgi:N-acetylmuramoyl-L-alanine amidase
LPYVQRLDARNTEDIELVVIHCTELPDLAMAREFGKKLIYAEHQTGNSGHYYIDRDGRIEQWVPLDRIAHHVRGFNPNSIGIELVNTGRYPHWFNSNQQHMTESYSSQQIAALATLLNHLQVTLPGLRDISGHEDLDKDLIAAEDQPGTLIRRKLDPGPCFPWAELMSKVSLQRQLYNEV